MYILQILTVFFICVHLTIYMCNASVCKNTKENLQTTQSVTDTSTTQVTLDPKTAAGGNTLEGEAQKNQQNLQDDGCQTLEVEFKCGQELRPYTGESKYVLSVHCTAFAVYWIDVVLYYYIILQ